MNKTSKLNLLYASSLMVMSTQASALSMIDYMVITELAPSEGNAFIMSNSEIGAIGVNGSTSSPGSLPTLPGGTERSVSSGITLDGDVAVTNNGNVTFSNSDVHAVNTGAANPGSQGIDCSRSFNSCTDNGSQISSNNRFNQSSPAATFSNLANNNGIQGGINLSDITDQIATFYSAINGFTSTGGIDLTGSGGQITSDTVFDFSGDGFSGLNIIDIDTDSNDFYIEGSNLTIKGDADDTVIFRFAEGTVMNVSESNLLLDGDIGDNNVLWYLDSDEGEESFNFNNVTFYGMSLWDIDPNDVKNVASFNSVQFCGQIVTDQVNFQNVSGSQCALDVSAVPVPAAVWLFGSGLIGLVGIARRKKS